MQMKGCFYLFIFAFIVATNSLSFANSQEEIPLFKGQTLYVPSYSHIYAGNRELPILLAVTLSIRNVDFKQSIILTSVDYYGTKGELIKKYLKEPIVLGPFETTRYVIPRDDKSGGSGANFLVEWKSGKSVNPPIVESVMIGAEGQQGISFTSRGQVITTSN
jgi:hypothetical protein